MRNVRTYLHCSSECALHKLPHYHLWWLVKVHENVGLFPAIFTLDKLTMFSNMLLEIDKAGKYFVDISGIDILS